MLTISKSADFGPGRDILKEGNMSEKDFVNNFTKLFVFSLLACQTPAKTKVL